MEYFERGNDDIVIGCDREGPVSVSIGREDVPKLIAALTTIVQSYPL